MADLILPLKAEYFDQIARGEKAEEYRLVTPYWTGRLIGAAGAHRCFDRIVLTKGYPKRSDDSRRLIRRWNGFVRKTLTHPHFGPDPVQVFAIDVTDLSEVERKVVAWLLKMQRRQVIADTGHGIMSARDVGQAHGLDKKAAATVLQHLADGGHIRRLDYASGTFWRTLNPLPWEPGGAWPTSERAST